MKKIIMIQMIFVLSLVADITFTPQEEKAGRFRVLKQKRLHMYLLMLT